MRGKIDMVFRVKVLFERHFHLVARRRRAEVALDGSIFGLLVLGQVLRGGRVEWGDRGLESEDFDSVKRGTRAQAVLDGSIFWGLLLWGCDSGREWSGLVRGRPGFHVSCRDRLDVWVRRMARLR